MNNQDTQDIEKEERRLRRRAAVSLQIDLPEGDGVRELFSRENGLFCVSSSSIMRLRSPDDLDPQFEHDAPWEQSLYLPHGASDPLVARTILQTRHLLEPFFTLGSGKCKELTDVSWEIMNSLVSLRVVKERLETQVHEIVEEVSSFLPKYTQGESPKPLPIVKYYDIEFRSFVNEVRRALSKISDLFAILTPKSFKDGHFHRALEWSRRERGPDALLTKMLDGDQRWIKTWIAIRVAIEHPETDKYVETLNFSLEADRQVRLPTWRFVHPDFDMARPQNLLDVFSTCIDNLLKFYEDLQVVLLDGHMPTQVKINLDVVSEDDRNPDCPMRYNIGH